MTRSLRRGRATANPHVPKRGRGRRPNYGEGSSAEN